MEDLVFQIVFIAMRVCCQILLLCTERQLWWTRGYRWLFPGAEAGLAHDLVPFPA